MNRWAWSSFPLVLLASIPHAPTLAACHAAQVSGLGTALATADLGGVTKSVVLVGAPFANSKGLEGSRFGRTMVLPVSGGPALFSIEGREINERMGSSVAFIGDVDGDQVPDFAAGAPLATRSASQETGPSEELAGRVTIYSGKSGKQIRDLWGKAHDQFGSTLVAIPDVDGDGVSDLLVGAPTAACKGIHGAGTVRAVSGKTGGTLFEAQGERAESHLGEALAALPDIDGDDIPDFAAGGPAGLEGAVVRIYSGKGAKLIRDLAPRDGWRWFGQSIASIGDIDCDKVPDLAVGIPGVRTEEMTLAGAVALFSGKRGTLIRVVDGMATGEQLGTSVVSPGDMNGDGIPDLCVGAPGAAVGTLKSAGLIRAISGSDAALLWTLGGTRPDARLGTALASGIDFDADGVSDLVVGAPGTDEVWIVSAKKGSLLRKVQESER